MAPVTIGLYGTISYTVKRRTTEVGICVALGAERGRVVWLILRSGMLLCSIWSCHRRTAGIRLFPLLGVAPLWREHD